MADAKFEDGDEKPLRLRAETADDVAVVSALLQDAVLEIADISWMPQRRRFVILCNRFRWEDKNAAESQDRPFQRVRALLQVDSALKVQSNGVDPAEKDTVVSVLSLGFEPGEDASGTLLITCAGYGEIALEVECIDVSLTDVSKPYEAISGKAPHHDL